MTSRSDRIIKTPQVEEPTSPALAHKDLYSVPENSNVRIKQVAGTHALKEQLKQMGIFAGDLILVKRRVPFGGALLVEHHGAQLAISKVLAKQIVVEGPE
jgi:Fe2+ transport system protein FeoA